LTAHCSPRNLEEAYFSALRKENGLASEFATLKDRWLFASRILENTDILPDIFRRGGIDSAMHYYSDFLRTPKEALRTFEDQPYTISDMGFALEKIARMISLIKSGFFQRTDSMDLPYVIAGIPLSPERSWGNELYLVAADKLVLNYIRYLNIPHFRWDRFISWSESRRDLGSLSGGEYIPFRGTFHLQMSMDIKYNFEGFLVLAHELAHAACQATVDTLGKKANGHQSYTILSNALKHAFELRSPILTLLKKCKKAPTRLCPLKEWNKKLTAAPDQNAFVEDASSGSSGGSFAEYLYECLMDSVAVKLAGTSYLSWMNNYAFQSPVCAEYPGGLKLTWNVNFFMGIFLRASLLEAFLSTESNDNRLNREYKLQATRSCEDLRSVSTDSLISMGRSGRIDKNWADSLQKCMECVSEVASLLGSRFSVYGKEIFEGNDIPVFSNDPAFSTNHSAIRGLRSGKTFVSIEPRKVLDSTCKVLKKTAKTTCPAALYSLAFNQHRS
jgi:hypothetical protein